MRETVQLKLRHGCNLMTTNVPAESVLKVGRKVRLVGDQTRLWLIEAIYPQHRMDFEPREYI